MHRVKCYYCGQYFDADKDPFIKVNNKRYAHKTCAENPPQKKEDALYEYIKQLFHMDYVEPRIQKQIKEYIEEYGFTADGILKALQWWYDIKKNPVGDFKNKTIGIVPYIYNQAQDFWFIIKLAQLANEDKDVKEYIIPQKEIEIASPRVENIKPKLFNLDDDENEFYHKHILANFDDEKEGFNI